MRWDSGRLSIAFSCVGHTYAHLFTAFYFTIILALENAWRLSYEDLLDLWLPASLLVGAAALPAGWLGDRWRLTGMMAIYFIGMGATSIAAGFVGGPTGLLVAMAGIGLFAAIYHPIAIPWVIRSATGRVGTTLAINGIFGGLGLGLAALVAGLFIDLFGWRMAFIAPGVVCLSTGVLMLQLILSGRIVEPETQPASTAERRADGNGDAVRGFVILLCTMFLGGLIFQISQTATPKLFDLRLRDWVGDGALGIGVLVSIVYLISSFAQFIGGWAADRWPLKVVYVQAWAFHIPVLLMAAYLGGPLLVLLLLLVASATTATLPAENMLLARFVPPRRHGLAFGVKFVVSFGTAPLAIKLVGWLQTLTGEFVMLYTLMGATAAAIMGLALLLPDRPPSAYTSGVADALSRASKERQAAVTD